MIPQDYREVTTQKHAVDSRNNTMPTRGGFQIIGTKIDPPSFGITISD